MIHHDRHDHIGQARSGSAADAPWLLAALVVILGFMVAEVTVGFVAHSLALIADGGHMLTDAVGIGLGLAAAHLVRRPARGAFTYGFARVDALSGQINGVTLILLAIWFVVEAVRRLVHPQIADGAPMTIVALVGVVVSIVATSLVGRADRESLSVRGVFLHLLTDLWAFAATAVAGIVIMLTDWHRADAVASLVVAAVMVWTGARLVRDAGRIFLEAAPAGTDPGGLGDELAGVDGVAELHDLHVWEIGVGESALSAHVLVRASYDCHDVSARMRRLLAAAHGISHVTLQTDHADHSVDDCEDAHGDIHVPLS
ncbi:MAG TPA: cation diffusion facilitator family transporter [Jatrophihabitans sp.]|jgi:cobalt-zinc-cadmium efflux system protein